MLGNLQSIFFPKKKNIFCNKKKKKKKKKTVKTNTHKSQSLLSSFILFNNRLFMCQHFDINSDLFLNIFTSSRLLIIKAFSLRHKLKLLIKVLPLTHLAIENLIVGTVPLSTNFQ